MASTSKATSTNSVPPQAITGKGKTPSTNKALQQARVIRAGIRLKLPNGPEVWVPKGARRWRINLGHIKYAVRISKAGVVTKIHMRQLKRYRN